MPKMPDLRRLPKLIKGMSEREARRKAAKEKENIKIQDEKDMASVQGAKEGGRIGLKAGSKGCKLAKRGRGRAYGKNS
jgi:hypothetical protein